MNVTLKILYKTKSTFDYLNNQYENKLSKNCILIFITLGAISGFESFYRELSHIKDYMTNGELTILLFLSTVIGAGLGVVIGGYIITYAIYLFGKLLKGIGDLIDIRVVVAYSMIPSVLKLPVLLYLGLSDKLNGIAGFEFWVINIFYLLIWVWSLKIMIQGIIRFHNFELWKAILTTSPLWIVGLVLYFAPYVITN
nr:Yip1 family protein [uncultured Carboxylicivirga sp.]